MPVQYKDYYETLGVARTASDDEIKKAFRKLARAISSRRRQGQKKIRGKIQGDQRGLRSSRSTRTSAKNTMSSARTGNPARNSVRRRATADSPAASPFAAAQPATRQEFEFGGTGFSDFFEQLFGQRTARRGRFWPRGEFSADRLCRTRPRHRGRHHGHAGGSHARFGARQSTCGIRRTHRQNRDASGQDSAGSHRGTEIAPAGRGERGETAARRAICICACGSPSIPTSMWMATI